MGSRSSPESGSRTSESGTALIFVVILMVTIGGMIMAHLGQVNSDQRRVRTKNATSRALDRALGELARAKNIVNAAPYMNGQNTALWAAINSTPPYVPGTQVVVERIGGDASHWFRLQAAGQFQGMQRHTQTFVRQRTPLSSYNTFVIDHPVAVSGAPRGRIHSNKSVMFMFPWGTYRDGVTASTGFVYKAGATAENTRFWGSANGEAPTIAVTSVDAAKLADKATTLKVTDDLLAHVTFLGKQTKVELYTPQMKMTVPRPGTRRVFDGYTTITQKRRVPTYTTTTYKVKVPKFREVSETVHKRTPVYKWIEVTRQEREPIYSDVKETYYEKEEVWGTKLVTRTNYEQTYVEGNVKTAAQGLGELVKRLEGLGLHKLGSGMHCNFGPSMSAAQKSLDAIKKSLYDDARKELAVAAQLIQDARTRLSPTGGDALLFDELSGRCTSITSRITLEKTNPAAAETNLETAVHIAQLEKMLASGAKRSQPGHFELKAIQDVVEVPYVVSVKQVAKTRLKRKKTGERLVQIKERIPKFSHYTTKTVQQKRLERIGEEWVTRTKQERSGSKVITENVDVPKYKDVAYTLFEEIVIPGTKTKEHVVDSKGVIYIEKAIISLSGQLNGKLTVVSNTSIAITGSVTYVDDSNNTRMLNGLDKTKPYEFNPAYQGDAVLQLVSRGDIDYSTMLPAQVEINASLVSTHGKVAMEGIRLSDDGTEIKVDQEVLDSPTLFVKDSLRRLGGILSRKRPVASFIKGDNKVIAGFGTGVALMDRRLILEEGGRVIPPAAFELEHPTWAIQVMGLRFQMIRD